MKGIFTCSFFIISIFTLSGCFYESSIGESLERELSLLYSDREKKPVWYDSVVLNSESVSGLDVWSTSEDDLREIYDSNVVQLCDELMSDLYVNESVVAALYFNEFSAIEKDYVVGMTELKSRTDGLKYTLVLNPHLEMEQDFYVIFRADDYRSEEVEKFYALTEKILSSGYPTPSKLKAMDEVNKMKFQYVDKCVFINIFLAAYGFETAASKYARVYVKETSLDILENRKNKLNEMFKNQ